MTITNYLGEIAAIGGAICFGLGNVLIKSQGDKIKPMAINAIRLGFSAIFYFILLVATGILKETFTINRRSALLLVFGSLLGIVVGDIIFFFSQQLIGLSRAYPIAVSYPLLTYITGIILGYEIYDKFRIQGVLLVILGVYLVSNSSVNPNDNLFNDRRKNVQLEKITDQEAQEKNSVQLNREKRKRRRVMLGIGGASTTAICWTFGTIMIDRGLQIEISGVSANAFRMICIAPVAFLIFATSNRGKQKSRFSWKGVLVILLAGIIGNTIGSFLYLFSLSFTNPSTTAAITAAAPLVATPLAIVFLKEKMSLLLVLGTLLTMSGIWLIII